MANDADITLPSLEIEGFSGATADIALSAPVVISGTGAFVGITLPILVVEAFAYSGIEEADIVLPSLVAEGLTGATCILELPEFTVEATSISGVICSADIELPSLSIVATTAGVVLATGELILPSFSIVATSIHGIIASADITLVSLSASGLTSLTAGEIIGYALNLRALGLSEYEDYNFNSLCVINGKSFGASSTGLYLLEGKDDEGTSIAAYVTFPLTDFGGDNEKRVRSVYYGGNSDGQLKLTTWTNEGDGRDRIFKPAKLKGKTIIPVGRGDKGEYWKFKVANIRGVDFELNSLESFLVVLRRNG